MTDHPRMHHGSVPVSALFWVADRTLIWRAGTMCAKQRLFRLAAIALCLVPICVASLARAAEDDWVVVTMARHGSWGVGVASSQAQAMAAAIEGCRAMGDNPTDCGARFTANRGGYIVGKLCGSETILVAGTTLHEAELAAFDRELELRYYYIPGMEPCRRILTVDPIGLVAGTQAHVLGSRRR